MAEVTKTMDLDGLQVNVTTNTSTGDRTVKSGTTTFATSSGTDGVWSEPTSNFLYQYNAIRTKKGQPSLSTADFNQQWTTSLSWKVNRVSADVFNNVAYYDSPAERDNQRIAFFDNRIQLVEHPHDGRIINNLQQPTSENIFGLDSTALFGSTSQNVVEEVDTIVGPGLPPPPPPPSSGDNVTYQSTSSQSASPVMRYPLGELPNLGYDYIQITSYEYVPAGTGMFTLGRDNPDRRTTARFGRSIDTIQLPMQPNIAESTSVDWGGDKLNEIQRLGAGIALGGINTLAERLGRGEIKEGFTSALTNILQGTGDAAKTLINDPALKPFIAAYFAGQAVGANVTARATGTVINPNLELLFGGPRLRTFNFNFRFTPRSDEEARIIRRIIKSFKKNMAPKVSTGNIFLKTPNIFKLEYLTDGRRHPFLHKFKPCALTAFTANYTPDGSYMTYRDRSMTSYTVAMTFGELEPNYDSDYDEHSNDMGF